jgi:hypothetical protein
VAPIASDEVCLGVTLIAPHTLYPLHRHNAVETYFVLSGTATWTAAGRSQTQPPGSFILHPSNIVHAMQTWDEPLLAVYTLVRRRPLHLRLCRPLRPGIPKLPSLSVRGIRHRLRRETGYRLTLQPWNDFGWVKPSLKIVKAPRVPRRRRR